MKEHFKFEIKKNTNIKELNKWRDIPRTWIGKMQYYYDNLFFPICVIQHNPNQNHSKLFCGYQ